MIAVIVTCRLGATFVNTWQYLQILLHILSALQICIAAAYISDLQAACSTLRLYTINRRYIVFNLLYLNIILLCADILCSTRLWFLAGGEDKE